jgi:hypothetical protein
MPPPAPDPAPKPKRKPAPELSFACGHARKAAKVLGQPCPACRDKARSDAKKVAKGARKARRAARPPRESAAPADGKAPGRLPHGSEFVVGYDAAGPAWSGTLTVPRGDGRLVFMAGCSGVVKLLRALDGLYREWIALHEGDPTP